MHLVELLIEQNISYVYDLYYFFLCLYLPSFREFDIPLLRFRSKFFEEIVPIPFSHNVLLYSPIQLESIKKKQQGINNKNDAALIPLCD